MQTYTHIQTYGSITCFLINEIKPALINGSSYSEKKELKKEKKNSLKHKSLSHSTLQNENFSACSAVSFNVAQYFSVQRKSMQNFSI